MNKKRLAYYVENYYYVGLERFVKDLLLSTDFKEYEVIIYSNAYNCRFIKELEKAPFASKIEIRPLNILCFGQIDHIWPDRNGLLSRILFSMIIAATKYTLFISNFFHLLFILPKFDVFHAINGGYPAADSCRAAVIVSKIKGTRTVIMSVLSTALPIRSVYYIFEPAIDYFIRRSVDCFHVNSMAAKKVLVQKRKFDPNRIVCVYTGINFTQTGPKTDFEKKTVVTIGTLGALLAGKGHVYMLEAAKILNDRYRGKVPLKYLIIGDGPERGNLVKIADNMGIGNLFNFIGYYNGEISDILKSLDIFIFPSLQESFPYAILEAMRAGLPIIASDIAGIPEQIIDQESGLLVPPMNSEIIASKITSLLDNPALMAKFGGNAFLRVKELFNIDITMNKIHELYA